MHNKEEKGKKLEKQALGHAELIREGEPEEKQPLAKPENEEEGIENE